MRWEVLWAWGSVESRVEVREEGWSSFADLRVVRIMLVTRLLIVLSLRGVDARLPPCVCVQGRGEVGGKPSEPGPSPLPLKAVVSPPKNLIDLEEVVSLAAAPSPPDKSSCRPWTSSSLSASLPDVTSKSSDSLSAAFSSPATNEKQTSLGAKDRWKFLPTLPAITYQPRQGFGSQSLPFLPLSLCTFYQTHL